MILKSVYTILLSLVLCPSASAVYDQNAVSSGSAATYNYFRDYEPATGRYVESDPIGLDGGLNIYAYAANDPILQIDPLGLANGPAIKAMGPPPLRPSPKGKVQLCCRPADIVNGLVDHCWLKTSTITDGMNETSQCTRAGNDASGMPFSPVVVSDHSCDKPERCDRYDVNEQCVNKELSIGRDLGRFSPVNNCQTFARDILEKCRKK